ncbi:WhiB family transcriptional regulator [Rhodococcus opacus]|uniref:WhiB family transcriptional regulator n=1 Tax=Rhodococcus opacus TaxID=37919 RepID=UPI002F96489F
MICQQRRWSVEPSQGLAALSPILEAWEWQRRARGRSVDTDFFFSCDGEGCGARARRERAAKQICHHCPVQHECCNHAIAFGESGVWGGTSETDRRTSSYSNTGQHSISVSDRNRHGAQSAYGGGLTTCPVDAPSTRPRAAGMVVRFPRRRPNPGSANHWFRVVSTSLMICAGLVL